MECYRQKKYVILEKLLSKITLKNYYMAGVTALAIQTGIRESFELSKTLLAVENFPKLFLASIFDIDIEQFFEKAQKDLFDQIFL